MLTIMRFPAHICKDPHPMCESVIEAIAYNINGRNHMSFEVVLPNA